MTKLLRVTKFVLTFINKMKGNHIEHDCLTTGELKEVETRCVCETGTCPG